MAANHITPTSGWRKLLRYARIYGWRRALVKAAGRRAPVPSQLVLRSASGPPDVSFIGCGQAAFGTLCFFLRQERGQAFLQAYDPSSSRAARLARFYNFESVAESAEKLLDDPRLRTVYIASNHASHAGYAVAALQRGLDVFVEKPIATTWEDLRKLEAAARASAGRFFAGYNRPLAAAIVRTRELWSEVNHDAPLSCTCRVYGHVIPSYHWYRRPEEGTRISGNAGHWLDLFVHLVSAVRGALPTNVRVELVPENPSEPDDNYQLTVVTEGGDTLKLHFTSYTEPADGVYEYIDLSCDDHHIHIDDFRTMEIRVGGRADRHVFQPKDVGHLRCTLQPWLPPAEQRDIEEVWCSARLVLHATDLAHRGGGIVDVELSSTPTATSFGAA